MWLDPKKRSTKKAKELVLLDADSIAIGHKTPAFWNQAAHRGDNALPLAELCFSLIARDRTVDLAAETAREAKQWRASLAAIIKVRSE